MLWLTQGSQEEFHVVHDPAIMGHGDGWDSSSWKWWSTRGVSSVAGNFLASIKTWWLAHHKVTKSVVRCRPSMVHMLSLCFLKKQYFVAFGRMKSLLEGSVSSLICSTLGELVHKLLLGFSEGGRSWGAHSLNPVASSKLVLLRIHAFLFFLILHFLP